MKEVFSKFKGKIVDFSTSRDYLICSWVWDFISLYYIVTYNYNFNLKSKFYILLFEDTGVNILILNENFKLLQKISFNIGEKREKISCMCISYNQETDKELVKHKS